MCVVLGTLRRESQMESQVAHTSHNRAPPLLECTETPARRSVGPMGVVSALALATTCGSRVNVVVACSAERASLTNVHFSASFNTSTRSKASKNTNTTVAKAQLEQSVHWFCSPSSSSVLEEASDTYPWCLRGQTSTRTQLAVTENHLHSAATKWARHNKAPAQHSKWLSGRRPSSVERRRSERTRSLALDGMRILFTANDSLISRKNPCSDDPSLSRKKHTRPN